MSNDDTATCCDYNLTPRSEINGSICTLQWVSDIFVSGAPLDLYFDLKWYTSIRNQPLISDANLQQLFVMISQSMGVDLLIARWAKYIFGSVICS